MTTGATGQLGLALPVQGELSGTWGDTVNNGLTQYINIAIAGTLTLTNDGAVTLANTTGDASASNVTSTLTGAGTVTAQFAIVRVTGTLTTAKVVTAPSYSKTYTVVNAATGGIVTFKASGQTGVSIAVGESAFVYFNGTDYVKVSGTASVTSFSAGTTGLTPSTSTTGAVTLAGTLAIANGGTGQTTANTALNALLPSQTGNANKYLQTDGTNSSWDAVSLSTADITGTLGTANGGTNLTSFTSGGVVYASSTSALATGSNLYFDATNLGVGTNNPQRRLHVKGGGALTQFESTTSSCSLYIGDSTSSVVDNQGIAVTGNNLFLFTSGVEKLRITSAGDVGIGTSSPSQKLEVSGTILAKTTSTPAIIARSTSTGMKVFYDDGRTEFTAVNYDGLSTVGAQDLFVVSGQKITFGVNSNGTVSYPLTLDTAGNLGLGVTPSAWNSNFKAFQISTGGSLSGAVSQSSLVDLGGNFYQDSGGTERYIASSTANKYRQYAGAHSWYTAASGTAGNSVSFTQAMTLDASGNLLIGSTANANSAKLKSKVSGGSVGFEVTDEASSDFVVVPASSAGVCKIGPTAGAMSFQTAGTERARITSGGDLYVGTTTGSIGTANFGVIITQAGSVIGSRNENGSVSVFYYGGNAGYAQILGNGNLQNSNGVYAAISDVKLKENIVDASPKLADLMQVKVRNYNLIGDTTKQIGVVAQELETVFPSMIDATFDKDAEGNDLGTTTKSVKYSVFVPMLIKAMQEQQAIIESLKARLDAANL